MPYYKKPLGQALLEGAIIGAAASGIANLITRVFLKLCDQDHQIINLTYELELLKKDKLEN